MPIVRKVIALTILVAIGSTPVPAVADDRVQHRDINRAVIEMLFGQSPRQVETREAAEGRRFLLGPVEPRNRGYRGTIRPYKPYRSHGKRHGIKKRPLPDRCLRWVNTGRGDRLAYGARCLNRNYRHASKLPRRCETLIRTNRGYRAVYGARCLARDGWRVARR